MSDAARPAKLSGLVCPECRGQRLHVYRTTTPCVGLVIRYRECSACGLRVRSEERAGRTIRPGRGKKTAISSGQSE